jgi:hypothetical protein
LKLSLKREDVLIGFSDVSYFWGQMGAGKTSIARLIDYCLGGSIQLTPALQSEFVAATLSITLLKGVLEIERSRDADTVIARWGTGDDAFQVAIPAREAKGEVIPQTGVEVLSDLIFWLSDQVPPRVRKSKVKKDSGVQRLSMRNLLWYCYLDQDEIDSSFFHLEENANPYQRYASLDVIRYVIGYHDEQVAEIEAQLEELRGERMATAGSIDSLRRVLREVGIETELQIQARVNELRERGVALGREIDAGRAAAVSDRTTTHALDQLRVQAEALAARIAPNQDAIRELRYAKDRDERHLNEIETLSLKFRRSQSARAVLSGVVFHSCPKCTQVLPERATECCDVCGQVDTQDVASSDDEGLIRRDIKSRADELREILKRHDASIMRLTGETETLEAEKRRIERARNEASERFDTAYLSSMLIKERERSALLQDAENLASMSRFPQMLEVLREKLAAITGNEAKLRSSLKEAREAAEKDTTNLDLLKDLFLDCLLRASVPGISREDQVVISPQTFLPEIVSPGVADSTVASFATLSSGGKKTLFKCCFAIAIHRLAVQVGAPLPELLIIDSPMKNISERENREQFKGFYNLVYELKVGELADTQVILIDKEYTAPSQATKLRVQRRHMKPDDVENPPTDSILHWTIVAGMLDAR